MIASSGSLQPTECSHHGGEYQMLPNLPWPSGATIMIMDTGIQSAGCEESCLGACSLPYHIHC